ncbi:MAG: hypothetical protein ACLRMJ_11185 [Alistipes finegoldii]
MRYCYWLSSWYWSSVTLFPHAHNIDGHIYVHCILSPVPRIIQHSHTPQQFQLIAPVAAGNDGGDARRIRLTAAGSFLHFKRKTGRPAGLLDPDLRAAAPPSADTHSILNRTGLLPAPVAMYMYQ